MTGTVKSVGLLSLLKYVRYVMTRGLGPVHMTVKRLFTQAGMKKMAKDSAIYLMELAHGFRTWNAAKDGIVYRGSSSKPDWETIYLHTRFMSVNASKKLLPRTIAPNPPFTWVPVRYFYTAWEEETI